MCPYLILPFVFFYTEISWHSHYILLGLKVLFTPGRRMINWVPLAFKYIYVVLTRASLVLTGLLLTQLTKYECKITCFSLCLSLI